MSKIGRKPISIPSGVTVEVKDGLVTVRGAQGQLQQVVPSTVEITQQEGELVVARSKNSRQARADHGLVRSLIENMVIGVSEGFTKKLELIGTGYRVAAKGAGLSITVGFSHPVEVEAIAGIKFATEGNTIIAISGIDKQLVGQVAADIRAIRPPEPYKGKGIRHVGEQIVRKQGKAAIK